MTGTTEAADKRRVGGARYVKVHFTDQVVVGTDVTGKAVMGRPRPVMIQVTRESEGFLTGIEVHPRTGDEVTGRDYPDGRIRLIQKRAIAQLDEYRTSLFYGELVRIGPDGLALGRR